MGTGQYLVVDPCAEARGETVEQLIRAGASAVGVGSGEAALAWMEEAVPAAVLAEVALPDLEASWLLHRVRHRAATARVPFFFLTGSDRLPAAQARRLGADDLLRKPAPPGALVALARGVPGTGGWTGRLEQLPLPELLALLLGGVRTATVEVRGGQGRLVLSQGWVVDARFRGREGDQAFLRLLTLEAGPVSVAFEVGGASGPLALGLEALQGPGAAHLRRWKALTAAIPPLDTRIVPNRRAGRLDGALAGLLSLLDGRRTLEEVVDESPVGDLTTLRAVKRLWEAGALVPATGLPEAVSDPEVTAREAAWFEDAELPEVDRLMSVLAGVQPPPRAMSAAEAPPPTPWRARSRRAASGPGAMATFIDGWQEALLRLGFRRWTTAAAALCAVALAALAVWMWGTLGPAGDALMVQAPPAAATPEVVPVAAPVPLPGPDPRGRVTPEEGTAPPPAREAPEGPPTV